ncbi:hypothetical protein SHKM778_83190 [Streptomyces sp. KM77-8]|uniref:HK97 gp10 family phage protein n=1 Tax=Streptomyces haneummycinicus TaxID=3074435 RepID=A0AAT9HXE7_9ACTN
MKEGPGSWDPGTHNTSPLLSPAQVAALKIINAKNGSVEAAYTAWHGLIRMERMRPNSKIVAGFAGKKDHRSINISNLRAFERDENLPENSLEYVRQKEGKIIDVAVAGGKDWHQLYNGRQAPHGFEGFEGVNYSTPAATAGTNFLRDTYTQGVASGITPKALR